MSQNNKNQPKNISWKFFNNLLPELSLARQEFPSVIADSTGASKIDRFPLEQHPLYCCLQSTPDYSNPCELETHANSNRNQFCPGFPSYTYDNFTLGNSNPQ